MSQAARLILLCLSVILLSSCASKNVLEGGGVPHIVIKSSSILDLQSKELKDLSPAKRKPVIAIYPNSFKDHTGQRKSNGQFALFSSAITKHLKLFLLEL